MGQLLFVVSRDAPNRYLDLKRAFSDQDAVSVILDRRTGERRRASQVADTDHRRSDRRARPEIESELRSIGYSVVRLPNAGPPVVTS